jgi:hypothetical protein
MDGLPGPDALPLERRVTFRPSAGQGADHADDEDETEAQNNSFEIADNQKEIDTQET